MCSLCRTSLPCFTLRKTFSMERHSPFVLYQIPSMHTMLTLLTYDESHNDHLDTTKLSDQQMLERFVDGFEIKTLFTDREGNYEDITEWPEGVEIRDGKVISFEYTPNVGLYEDPVGGVALFRFLPRSVLSVILCDNYLEGPVDTGALPPNLKRFIIDRNEFSGSLAIETLPPTLIVLAVANNALSGSLALTKLPPALEVVDFGHNNFSGSADLTQLPAPLIQMCLDGNALSGSLDFGHLSQSLARLSLKENKFSGGIDFAQLTAVEAIDIQGNAIFGDLREISKLSKMQLLYVAKNSIECPLTLAEIPPSLVVGDFGGNRLTAPLTTSSLPEGLEVLRIDSCSYAGTFDFQILPQTLQELNCENNQLCGGVDAAKLPKALQSLNLKENQFSGEFDVAKVLQAKNIDISHNHFEGTMRFDSLPKTLETLVLANNALTGSVRAAAFPTRLSTFDIRNNNFTGDIVVPVTFALATVRIGGNKFGEIEFVKAKKE